VDINDKKDYIVALFLLTSSTH